MVGADQAFGIAGALFHQRVAAVPAQCRHRVNLAVMAVRDDQRLAQQRHSHVIARLRDLLHPADAQPGVHEHRVALEIEERLRHVGFLRHDACTGRMIDRAIADFEAVEHRRHVGMNMGISLLHVVAPFLKPGYLASASDDRTSVDRQTKP